MTQLVLDVPPGLGILGKGFEEEGFCVVRGPDLLWGSDMRDCHPPAGKFGGVIGGTPCQSFSRLVHIVRANGYEPRFGDLVPEFARIIAEAQPLWALMENVEDAPLPEVSGYLTRDLILDNRWLGGEQRRRHRFSFLTVEGLRLEVDVALFENARWAPRVTHSAREWPVALGGSGKPKRKGGRHHPGGGPPPSTGPVLPLERALELQGLPADFFKHSPFTMKAKRQMLGDAVPLPMGRAIARAVKRALDV